MHTEEEFLSVEEKSYARSPNTATISYQLKPETIGKFLVQKIKVINPNTPLEFNNYRIIQLSDFHFGPATSKQHLVDAIKIINKLCPDIILLTGDYLQLTRTGCSHLIISKFNKNYLKQYVTKVRRTAREFGQIISELSAEEGIFGVFGNHDYIEGIDIVKEEMPNTINWLTNSYTNLEKENSFLHLAGIDDLLRGKPNLDLALSDFNKVDKPFYKILLSHNPDITIDPLKDQLSNFNLILSGHTHGGQIRLPFLPPPVTRTKQKKHVAGLSYLKDTAIYVTNGLGYGCLNLRVFCPPEITVIDFSRL